MAVRRQAGEAAFIQRCQVHKKRNVVDHLLEEYKTDVKEKLQNAYAMADYADAKRALERLHRLADGWPFPKQAEAGVEIPSACRQGQSGSCKTRLLDGQVRMTA